MRCLFASDLHGQPQLFAELVAWVGQQKAQAVILGGDVLTDAAPAQWANQLAFIRTRLKTWLVRLQEAGVDHVAYLHGNHDWAATDDALLELQAAGLLTLLPDYGEREFAGLPVFSYAFTPPSPFVIKDYEKQDLPGPVSFAPSFEGLAFDRAAGKPVPVRLTEFLKGRSTIAADLDTALPPALPGKPWLFVCHGPPASSTADLLWLPPTGEPATTPSTDFSSGVHKLNERLHVGSQSIAAFIVRTQPTLSLHGHVHESPYLSGRYVNQVRDSHVINPGQRRDRLHAVLFDTADPAGTLWHTVWGTRDGPASTGDVLPPRPSFCM